MKAADESKGGGGAEVLLSDVLEKARADLKARHKRELCGASRRMLFAFDSFAGIFSPRSFLKAECSLGKG
jgi:hypothetical protein